MLEILGNLGLVLFCGFFIRKLFERIHLPALCGYMLLGILFGPWGLNLMSASFMDLSADFRQAALLVILLRAGMGLDLKTILSHGKSALMLCFVPALFEIAGYALCASFLGFTLLEALLLGSVMAAVSPAVIVPRMLKLSGEGYDSKTPVVQMVLAGASLDDIFCITIFTLLLSLVQAGSFSWSMLLTLPLQLIISIPVGILAGKLMQKLSNMARDSLMMPGLALAMILSWLEKAFPQIPFSALMAVFVMAFMMQKTPRIEEMKKQANGLWYWLEMLLFFLVGAIVSLGALAAEVWLIIPIMLLALGFRSIGVWCSLIPSHLPVKEKIFCILSYLPKATVQAGIGAIPLSYGLSSGMLILSFAAFAILITAPVGALLIDHYAHRLLPRPETVAK